jgi:predicted DNA-binding transcriptional regulator
MGADTCGYISIIKIKKSTKRRLNKAIGVGLVAAGAIGISLYDWLVFFSPWQILILQLTIFVATAAVFSILAWVGRALTTIPPPKSMVEIEKSPESNGRTLKTTQHNS